MCLTIVAKRRTASHARLTWLTQGLRIEWGSIRRLNFKPTTIEMLRFEEYPELKDLYDGEGWDLDELHKLLIENDATALPEAVTLLLVQKDLNLLTEAGLSLEAI